MRERTYTIPIECDATPTHCCFRDADGRWWEETMVAFAHHAGPHQALAECWGTVRRRVPREEIQRRIDAHQATIVLCRLETVRILAGDGEEEAQCQPATTKLTPTAASGCGD